MSGFRSLLRQAFQPRWVALSFTPVVVWALASAPATLRTKDPGAPVTLSLVGTTDLHGQIFSTQRAPGACPCSGAISRTSARHGPRTAARCCCSIRATPTSMVSSRISPRAPSSSTPITRSATPPPRLAITISTTGRRSKPVRGRVGPARRAQGARGAGALSTPGGKPARERPAHRVAQRQALDDCGRRGREGRRRRRDDPRCAFDDAAHQRDRPAGHRVGRGYRGRSAAPFAPGRRPLSLLLPRTPGGNCAAFAAPADLALVRSSVRPRSSRRRGAAARARQRHLRRAHARRRGPRGEWHRRSCRPIRRARAFSRVGSLVTSIRRGQVASAR